ncbi:hypothetical protein GOBAR_AA01377 [Gossypium barbadense]|uniref:Signal recognition particle SRP54 subunit M-domain domain-containing protein n=1 Tax=Gossypium barbadense TaxID=3634 RepID=A0A2P5YUC1_GOSBA|nr:hypothetical protein GOBAR_AA01377 [Gossypium barbadense]
MSLVLLLSPFILFSKEREKPELLAESPDRRRRIAKDSGKTEQHVSQLVAQLFQMRVRMKNLMGIMESGSIPTLSNLEDAMKAEQTLEERGDQSREGSLQTRHQQGQALVVLVQRTRKNSSLRTIGLQPSNQSQASGSDFPVPSWSHPSHYPSSTGS